MGKREFKLLFTVLTLCVMSSCGTEEQQEGVLEKEKMAHIMLDVYRAEALLNSNVSDINNEVLFKDMMQRVYDRHEITDSVYKANINWYMAHPSEFNMVYDMVIDSVKLKQQLRSSPDTNFPNSSDTLL